MIPTLKITTIDKATPAFVKLLADIDPKRQAKIVGPRVQELTRDHLAALGTNKRGWPSTGFWEDAARATRWIDHGNGSLTVEIDKIGVRQRYKGGHIAPKNAKALTIPINPEAYGKTAKDFSNLVLITTPKGAYLAQSSFEHTGVTKAGVRTRRGRGNPIQRQRLTFLFKLVKGVDQDANPNVLPKTSEYQNTALLALGRAIQKNLN